jgi:lipopolysaccharide export LptBFGC system permease protein LptF
MAFLEVSRSSIAAGMFPLLLLCGTGCLVSTAQLLHSLPIGLLDALYFSCLGLGPLFSFVLPLCCLLSVSTASFLMLERGALSALALSGVPQRHLLFLPIAAALLLLPASLAMNHWLVPKTQDYLQDAIAALEPKLLPGKSESFGGYSIFARSQEGEAYAGLAVAGPDFVGFAATGRFSNGSLTLNDGQMHYIPTLSLRMDFEQAELGLGGAKRSSSPSQLTTEGLMGRIARREGDGIESSYERKELYKRTSIPLSLFPLSVSAFALAGFGLRPSAVSFGLSFLFWASIRGFDLRLATLGPSVCAALPFLLSLFLALLCADQWRRR